MKKPETEKPEWHYMDKPRERVFIYVRSPGRRWRRAWDISDWQSWGIA